MRFIFPSEKPVVAHQRRRDKSVVCQQGCCRGASKDELFVVRHTNDDNNADHGFGFEDPRFTQIRFPCTRSAYTRVS